MENQPPPPIAVLSTIAQEINSIRHSGTHYDIPSWLWNDLMRWHSEAVQSLDHARAQRDAA